MSTTIIYIATALESLLAALNLIAGCSECLSSKAAGEQEPEAYTLRFVEGLNDARTPHGKKRVSAR
jgi:hypothetical protein